MAGPVFVNDGDLVIEPKASFGAAGTFDLASGAVVNHGGFGIDKSVLQVSGGSLMGNPATDVYYLGAGPATVTFEPSTSASSVGHLEFGIGLTVNGVIPKKWVLDNVGGPGAALTANHSGNKGTLIWDANAALTATGPFVNSGTLNVTCGSFELAAQDVVNAAGGKILVNGDSGISAPGNFHNYGSFELGAGNRASVSGNYSQASGGTFAVDAGGGQFQRRIIVGRRHRLAWRRPDRQQDWPASRWPRAVPPRSSPLTPCPAGSNRSPACQAATLFCSSVTAPVQSPWPPKAA